MTEFWLIRHGQTNWNLEGRWQGQASYAPPLNETGRAQAEAAAAQLLDGQRFGAIYSSDLLRARETAEIIAARLGLRVRLEPRLREVNLGIWEGLMGMDIAQRYPAELAERERNPVHARPPGGETLAEVAKRVWAAADEAALAQAGARLVIVAHGLSLATLICRARNMPLEKAYAIIPDNAHPEVIAWHPFSGNSSGEFV